ncbi:MAG: diiron oxygenase [Myxococcota bacterium]
MRAVSARRRLGHALGPFRAIHDALVAADVPWEALTADAVPAGVRDVVRAHWAYRVETEYRSIQVMTRFLAEVLAAGDPLEVYAGAADAIADEVRHTALCLGVAERLGVVPLLPDPVELLDPPGFAALPAAQRALGTAVSMLVVSETISVALIEDLRRRATHPTVRAVLERTLRDEDAHDDFGWAYLEASLARFGDDGRGYARVVAETTLAPHLGEIEAMRAALPRELQHLERWPEPELAAFGVMGRERQALVKRAVIAERLAPRLAALGLGPGLARDAALR